MKNGCARAVVGFLILLLLAGGGAAWTWKRRMDEREHQRRWGAIVLPERVARVTDVWSAQTLAERLFSSQKIRDAGAFQDAARKIGLEQVEPGGYALPAKAGPSELARIFKAGPTLQKVTFPEGWTVWKMAARLQAARFAGAADLERLAYPAGQDVSPLEGRLFPDTYYLPTRGNGRDLAGRMQQRWRAVVKDLPTPFPAIRGKRLTMPQLLTLASLVEREAATPKEMPLVAGVLLNRLRKGMRLQVDATVQYARVRAEKQGLLDEGHKARLLYRDLEIESPFNTYKHDGLPPGPICNPGEDALHAAARPQSSPYFFYVLSPRLGRHLFARTFEEHKHNRRIVANES